MRRTAYSKGVEDMDKHSTKISVKLNGVEKNYTEASRKKEEKEREMPRKEADFEWVLPSKEPEYSNVVPFYNKNSYKEGFKNTFLQKDKGVGKKIAAIILTASLFGTGLGFIVLNVLGSNEPLKEQQPQTVAVTPKQTVAASEKESSKSSAVSKIEPLSLYVVQGGAFTATDKAKQALEDAKQKGVPASLVDMGDKILLLIGISNEETVNKTMGQTYKKKGLSTWEKPLAAKSGTVAKQYEKQAEKILLGSTFFQRMVEAASVLYSGQKITEEKWNSLQKEFKSLSGQSKTIKQEEIKKFFGYSTLSYNALKEYKESKKEADFLKLQQFLLDGLAAYEAMMSKMVQ